MQFTTKLTLNENFEVLIPKCVENFVVVKSICFMLSSGSKIMNILMGSALLTCLF